MSDLHVTFDRPSPKLALARLRGDFEGQSLLDVKEKLLETLRAQAGSEFMLDFSEVGYIDSSGVGVLLEMTKVAAACGARFGLLNVPEPVLKVLTVTRVDKIIKIYGSV